MTDNELTKMVVDAPYHIHVQLEPGLLESVYRIVLARELRKRGLNVQRELKILIRYEGLTFDEGFQADLVVENKLVVECKSVEKTHPVHKKQLLAYLCLMDKQLGLLINFGDACIKDGIAPVVNGLDETPSTDTSKQPPSPSHFSAS
jgi:GxxExxY protein